MTVTFFIVYFSIIHVLAKIHVWASWPAPTGGEITEKNTKVTTFTFVAKKAHNTGGEIRSEREGGSHWMVM
jgi:hypothetical protein